MAHGRNNGKKLMAVRIIAHAFEIVSPADPDTTTDIDQRPLRHSMHQVPITRHEKQRRAP